LAVLGQRVTKVYRWGEDEMFYEHDCLIRLLPYRCAGPGQSGCSPEEETKTSSLTAEQYVIYQDLGG